MFSTQLIICFPPMRRITKTLLPSVVSLPPFGQIVGTTMAHRSKSCHALVLGLKHSSLHLV